MSQDQDFIPPPSPWIALTAALLITALSTIAVMTHPIQDSRLKLQFWLSLTAVQTLLFAVAFLSHLWKSRIWLFLLALFLMAATVFVWLIISNAVTYHYLPWYG